MMLCKRIKQKRWWGGVVIKHTQLFLSLQLALFSFFLLFSLGLSNALAGEAKTIKFEKIYKVNFESVDKTHTDINKLIFNSKKQCNSPQWSKNGKYLSFFLEDHREKLSIIAEFNPESGSLKNIHKIFSKTGKKSLFSAQMKNFTWSSTGQHFLVQNNNAEDGTYISYLGASNGSFLQPIKGMPNASVSQMHLSDQDDPASLLISLDGRLNKCELDIENASIFRCVDLFPGSENKYSVYRFSYSEKIKSLVTEEWRVDNQHDLHIFTDNVFDESNRKDIAAWPASPEIAPSISPSGNLFLFLSKGSPKARQTENIYKDSAPWKLYLLPIEKNRGVRRDSLLDISDQVILSHSALNGEGISWIGRKSLLLLSNPNNLQRNKLSITGYTDGRGKFTIDIPTEYSDPLIYNPPPLKANEKIKESFMEDSIEDIAAYDRFVAFTAKNKSGKKRLYIGVLSKKWENWEYN